MTSRVHAMLQAFACFTVGTKPFTLPSDHHFIEAELQHAVLASVYCIRLTFGSNYMGLSKPT